MQVTTFINPEWLVEIEVDAVIDEDSAQSHMQVDSASPRGQRTVFGQFDSEQSSVRDSATERLM